MKFTWSDAWVFISINHGIDESEQLDFASFIAAGDAVNHAIMTVAEIKEGFYKLYSKGLIEIVEGNVSLTELSKPIIDKVSKKRGGQFSIVDNCLKVLNSSTAKHPELSTKPDLNFLTEKFVSDSYKKYQTQANAI